MPPAVPPAIPIPDEKLPVAMGMRSPIFNLAVWPSTERTSGFWIIFVAVSVRTAFAVRLGKVTSYALPFKCLIWANVVAAVVVVVLELLLVVLFGLIATLVVCPGGVHKSRRRSVRAGSIPTCNNTSGSALS